MARKIFQTVQMRVWLAVARERIVENVVYGKLSEDIPTSYRVCSGGSLQDHSWPTTIFVPMH